MLAQAGQAPAPGEAARGAEKHTPLAPLPPSWPPTTRGRGSSWGTYSTSLPTGTGPRRPQGCGAPGVSGSHCSRPAPAGSVSVATVVRWPGVPCRKLFSLAASSTWERSAWILGPAALRGREPPPVFPKPSPTSGGAGRAMVGGGSRGPSLPGTAGRDRAGLRLPGGRRGTPWALISQGVGQGPGQSPRGQEESHRANGVLAAESGRPWLSAPLPSGRRTAAIPLVSTTGRSACVLQQGTQVTAPDWPSWDLSPGPEAPGFRGPPTAQVPSRSPGVTPPNYQSPSSLSP